MSGTVSIKDLLGRGAVYREKLGQAEWKEFARSARERAGNACEICRRSDVQLQVHHAFYEPGRDPWEYAGEDVVVLCRGCHHETHVQLQKFRRFVFKKFNPASFRVLNGALAVAGDHYDPLKFAYAVAELAASPGAVERFFKAFMDKPSTPTISTDQPQP